METLKLWSSGVRGPDGWNLVNGIDPLLFLWKWLLHFIFLSRHLREEGTFPPRPVGQSFSLITTEAPFLFLHRKGALIRACLLNKNKSKELETLLFFCCCHGRSRDESFSLFHWQVIKTVMFFGPGSLDIPFSVAAMSSDQDWAFRLAHHKNVSHFWVVQESKVSLLGKQFIPEESD